MSRGRDESGTVFFVASTVYVQVDNSTILAMLTVLHLSDNNHCEVELLKERRALIRRLSPTDVSLSSF